MDHVPPLTEMEMLGADFFASRGIIPATVPACLECNNWLSRMPLWDLASRREKLAIYYKRRYMDLLDQPKWSMDEIDELGGTLRQYVQAKADERAVLVRRLYRLTDGQFSA